nr:tripartite tricarboxylate transporter substrate binding protein [Variovorax sp. E3]
MRLRRRQLIGWLGAAAALPALHATSHGAEATLPRGPIRILVGFPPGGGTDILARILSVKLTTLWSVPVVVENKAGAAGMIATAEAAKAAPDGRSLLMGHINALGIAPGLYPQMPYSAERDFAPIVLVGKTPQVLIASRDSPMPTLAGLLAACRAHPGLVSFGSAGAGSAQHLALALFEQRAGVQVLHVPYKGSAPMVNDLLGGHVKFAFEGMTTAMGLLKDGKAVALAQTGARRASALSQVPTLAESGFPGFEASIWFGVVGPAAMPPELVRRMNIDLNKVLAQPEVATRLAEFGAEEGGGTPEAFGEYIRGEQRKWAQLIRDRKISADS